MASPFPDRTSPENFARPLIATEDHRYYSEPGLDPLAVGRVVQARLTGGTDQGGATIEQQLAKMLYTPGQQSGFGAEFKQVALAVKLNLTYSKQEILDLYAEVAYYGHGYYGLQAASCGYFGHPASELTVVQGAMLAGVVNAPSVDDPINDPANARARLEHVVARMVAVGYLTSAQGSAVLATPLGLTAARQRRTARRRRLRQRRRGQFLGRVLGRRDGVEDELPVAEQPEHRREHDADDRRDVEREPVVVAKQRNG